MSLKMTEVLDEIERRLQKTMKDMEDVCLIVNTPLNSVMKC